LIVIDASAVLEWLLRSQIGATVERRMFSHSTTLHAPHLLDVEVAQVLRRYVLAGWLTPARAGEAIEDLTALPVNRYAHDLLLGRIWELRNNLTAYDGAYVALAELLDAPLITCDRRIANAPGFWARVEVL
jgi:predicted nucleic acid-binding protein